MMNCGSRGNVLLFARTCSYPKTISLRGAVLRHWFRLMSTRHRLQRKDEWKAESQEPRSNNGTMAPHILSLLLKRDFSPLRSQTRADRANIKAHQSHEEIRQEDENTSESQGSLNLMSAESSQPKPNKGDSRTNFSIATIQICGHFDNLQPSPLSFFSN
jgi:hypothetical protein